MAHGKAALGFCGLAPGHLARRPHAIGRAARVRGALGSRVLTRLAEHASTVRRSLQASRGPLSRLAGTRARTPAALGYAASEVSPAARAPSLTSAMPEPGTADLDECAPRLLTAPCWKSPKTRPFHLAALSDSAEAKLGARAAGSATDGTCVGAPRAQRADASRSPRKLWRTCDWRFRRVHRAGASVAIAIS